MADILVTGGSGVAGAALEALLVARGADVRILRGRADGDLEDWHVCRAVFERERPRFVYHLAGAVFGIGGNTAFPGDAFRRNTLLNLHVVEASRQIGVEKIVAMGTAAIYADGLQQPMRESDALTGEPHASEYAYAFAKRGLLVQLESYRRQFGTRFAYAISTNLYGPHDRFNVEYGHVIPSLLMKFECARRDGGVVEIWGDGSPQRDFLYAEDAAAGLALMMEQGDGSYNLASGTPCTISELVTAIAAFYPDVAYRWNPDKPLGQLRRSYDVGRIKGIDFQAAHSIESGLAATIDWVRSNFDELRV
ncbi:NAD-dependent epimerase/dehydratase family protein [Sphingomonas sp. CARO-RG-8B-R24-01]|uniref:NAD-dependent epimerase/dehydratase family protein n=1 Tax=Sphingomonas sp. CARO-RG-8B-R24-01 TaxID=2914831 RepID=UPI001F59B6B7